jgi:hypothetical protein
VDGTTELQAFSSSDSVAYTLASSLKAFKFTSKTRVSGTADVGTPAESESIYVFPQNLVHDLDSNSSNNMVVCGVQVGILTDKAFLVMMNENQVIQKEAELSLTGATFDKIHCGLDENNKYFFASSYIGQTYFEMGYLWEGAGSTHVTRRLLNWEIVSIKGNSILAK